MQNEQHYIKQILALGFVLYEPQFRKKSVHCFMDPLTGIKYITYSSGWVQRERTFYNTMARNPKLTNHRNYLNPKIKIPKATYGGGVRMGIKGFMLHTEEARLAILLGYLQNLRNRQVRDLKRAREARRAARLQQKVA